jgi:hypothetical protein
MGTPHEPSDPLNDLIERARKAHGEWQAAEEELRAYAEQASLSQEQRHEVEEIIGPRQPHHRRRWGAAPS